MKVRSSNKIRLQNALSIPSVKYISTIASFGLFFVSVPALAQSRYGLTCYGGACTTQDQTAANRMATARTICSSKDTGIFYPKKNKPTPDEMTIYWQDINAAQRVATSSYREVGDCAQADLVSKITLDTLNDSVSLIVTDGDSGDAVFSETRTIQDKRSDLIRAAQHFRDAVSGARSSVETERLKAEREYRQYQESEAKKHEEEQCNAEFASLKQNIVAYIDIQHTDLPQAIREQVAAHNHRCANAISIDLIRQQQKEEAEAKASQEQAVRDQTLREKLAARLETERAAAFAAYTHQISEAPFVPPVEGWTHPASLGSALWYIILPRTGFSADCHFALNGSHDALDCLGAEGRNDYVAVNNNSRWYLLRAKRINSGEHAASVKDKGLTLCLRQASCYHILAEVRQAPTALPDKLQMPAPENLSASYSSDDLAFNYPKNWAPEERKDKDNNIVLISVTPPGAHLGNWVTHGLFVGHVAKISAKFPATLDGAYEEFREYQRLRGLTIYEPKTQDIGNGHGKIAAYRSSSVLQAGESGWVAVVKDHGEGYYYLSMFYPSNEDTALYTQTFNGLVGTFRFKK